MMLPVFHGEPEFWNKAHGTRPNAAPVYGKAIGRNGQPVDLDQEVLVHRGFGMEPVRAKVVGIGDAGLPDRNTVKIRQYGSAHLSSASSKECEIWRFDEYEWLCAETAAAGVMTKRDVDLARCMFGGFYFDVYQREVMKAYLGARKGNAA